jgi:hypothetical protein
MANRFWVGGTATWNGTAGTKWATTSGGAGGAATPSTIDDVFFDGPSGAVTVTTAAGAACKSLTFTGFAGTFAGSSALSVSDGNLTLGAGMNLTYTGALTMASTSGTTRSVTSNGIQFKGNLSINGVGGVFQLGDACSMTGATTFTVVNGTFNQNGKSLTTGKYNSNNTNTRTLNMDGATVVTGTGVCVSMSATIGLTMNWTGSLEIQTTNAGAQNPNLGAHTYGPFSVTGAGASALSISGTGGQVFVGSVAFSASNAALALTYNAEISCTSLSFAGFAGNFIGTSDYTLSGDLTMGAAMTNSYTGDLLFNGSGSQTITSNGITLTSVIEVNCSGTVKLGDAFISTMAFIITAGGFDTQNNSFQGPGVIGGLGSPATITLGTSIFTISSWGISDPTGIVLSALSSTMRFNNGIITGGGLVYGTIELLGGNCQIGSASGSGALTGDTYTTLSISANTNVDVLNDFPTVVGTFNAPGTSGNAISIQSFVPGNQATFAKAKNFTSNVDYLNLTDIVMTGGAFWYTGANSTIANCDGMRLMAGMNGRAST